jgi:hypothetical protein
MRCRRASRRERAPGRLTHSLLLRPQKGIARERRLRWLMPEASVEESGLFLYFPRGAAEMPKLRAFIDAAKDVSRPAANGSGWRNPPALDAVTPLQEAGLGA